MEGASGDHAKQLVKKIKKAKTPADLAALLETLPSDAYEDNTLPNEQLGQALEPPRLFPTSQVVAPLQIDEQATSQVSGFGSDTEENVFTSCANRIEEFFIYLRDSSNQEQKATYIDIFERVFSDQLKVSPVTVEVYKNAVAELEFLNDNDRTIMLESLKSAPQNHHYWYGKTQEIIQLASFSRKIQLAAHEEVIETMKDQVGLLLENQHQMIAQIDERDEIIKVLVAQASETRAAVEAHFKQGMSENREKAFNPVLVDPHPSMIGPSIVKKPSSLASTASQSRAHVQPGASPTHLSPEEIQEAVSTVLNANAADSIVIPLQKLGITPVAINGLKSRWPKSKTALAKWLPTIKVNEDRAAVISTFHSAFSQ